MGHVGHVVGHVGHVVGHVGHVVVHVGHVDSGVDAGHDGHVVVVGGHGGHVMVVGGVGHVISVAGVGCSMLVPLPAEGVVCMSNVMLLSACCSCLYSDWPPLPHGSNLLAAVWPDYSGNMLHIQPPKSKVFWQVTLMPLDRHILMYLAYREDPIIWLLCLL